MYILVGSIDLLSRFHGTKLSQTSTGKLQIVRDQHGIGLFHLHNKNSSLPKAVYSYLIKVNNG